MYKFLIAFNQNIKTKMKFNLSFLTFVLVLKLTSAQLITDISAWPKLDAAPPSNPTFITPVLAKLKNIAEAKIISDCVLPSQWAITYDDGPSVSTPILLDYLKLHNLKASFCVVGSRITEYPGTNPFNSLHNYYNK